MTFFHRKFKAIKIKNNIKGISLDYGSKISIFQAIKDVDSSHIESLCSEEQGVEHEIIIATLEHILMVIIKENNIELKKPIEDPKKINAISNLALDKAPGPDRFSI